MKRTVTVVPEAGVHARPASTVHGFEPGISVGRTDDDHVSANSMLAVSEPNVGHGGSVHVVAEELDALEAPLTTPVEGGEAE